MCRWIPEEVLRTFSQFFHKHLNITFMEFWKRCSEERPVEWHNIKQPHGRRVLWYHRRDRSEPISTYWSDIWPTAPIGRAPDYLCHGEHNVSAHFVRTFLSVALTGRTKEMSLWGMKRCSTQGQTLHLIRELLEHQAYKNRNPICDKFRHIQNERERGRARGTGTERGQPLSVCLTAEQVLNHLLLSVHVSDSGKIYRTAAVMCF